MPEPFFNPTFPGAVGPAGPTPGAKAPAPAPSGGPTFGEELSQALNESQPQGASEMKVEAQATDQRLNELRADLNLVRQSHPAPGIPGSRSSALPGPGRTLGFTKLCTTRDHYV